MSWNGESSQWESAQDVLEYLKFAGFEVTRDQLARLHRRRLISQPFQGPTIGRGHVSTYPSGTAHRVLRISQLKEGTKQLDELAWRLWWEGYDVEPDLVRAYLLKKAARWDEQLREIRSAATPAGATDDDEDGERDILDEVFFQHLKVGPSLVSARRQLGRGSDLYIGFSGLLIDLLEGDMSTFDLEGEDLFASNFTDLTWLRRDEDPTSAGGVAKAIMRAQMTTPYIKLVDDLDDKQIANARLVALRFLRIIASVGGIVHEVFGGAGRGRDNIGKSLIGLSESSDEQVLSLVLTSAFLRDDLIRERLEGVESPRAQAPAVTFRDFLRLRYLATEVVGLASLLDEGVMKDVFESPEEARKWRVAFDQFLLEHADEIEAAVAARRDLFDDEIPDDYELEDPPEVESKKKNPK